MEVSIGAEDWLDSLRESVASTNVKHVRKVLDSLGIGEVRKQNLKNHSDLIHLLIQNEIDRTSKTNQDKIMILYMLIDAGLDVNSLDSYNTTPLWLAMKSGNIAITQVLLQCGANTSQIYQNISLWNWLMESDDPENTMSNRCSWCKNVQQLRQIFEKYGRGLGPAVVDGQIDLIRLAINLCCRTDITVNGQRLIDVAFDNGNDDITKLILRVTPYLNLAHHILAQDVAAVAHWYHTEVQNSSSTFPTPLFHFGPYGNVPLIYFAIQYQNLDLIRLLLSKGHRVTARISHEDVGDMPVLFSALQPDMPIEIVQTVLENLDNYEEKLHHLFWLDCNVLQVAIRRRCSVQVTKLLINQGGPRLLCLRNAANETARDMAHSLQLFSHVEAIDEIVISWLTGIHSLEKQNQSLLALYSYELGPIFEDEFKLKSLDQVQNYRIEFYQLQEQLENLYNAIMDKNVETTRQLMYFSSSLIGKHHLALECRLAGEGLPLLHIAVLNKADEIVSIILEDATDEHDINNLRDQFGRTALHYAYASTDSSQLIRTLINAGCTEAVFDMNGRRPDDYKEMRGSPEMERLLNCLRIQDYSSPLVDPLEPDLVYDHRLRQWERRVEAYRQNKSAFIACRGSSLQNGSHFRHPVNDQPLWCTLL